MPYISKHRREIYDDDIRSLIYKIKSNSLTDYAGDFTYIVYRLLKIFSGKFWLRALGIGCMVCAILEMYRRDHALYEDEKIRENGEI